MPATKRRRSSKKTSKKYRRSSASHSKAVQPYAQSSESIVRMVRTTKFASSVATAFSVTVAPGTTVSVSAPLLLSDIASENDIIASYEFFRFDKVQVIMTCVPYFEPLWTSTTPTLQPRGVLIHTFIDTSDHAVANINEARQFPSYKQTPMNALRGQVLHTFIPKISQVFSATYTGTSDEQPWVSVATGGAMPWYGLKAFIEGLATPGSTTQYAIAVDVRMKCWMSMKGLR